MQLQTPRVIHSPGLLRRRGKEPRENATVPFRRNLRQTIILLVAAALGAGCHKNSAPQDGAGSNSNSCVVGRLIRGASTTPSNVSLFFTENNCQGQPVSGLTCDSSSCDLTIKEDGQPLSSEAAATLLPAKGLGNPSLTQTGIEAFAGEAELTEIQAPTLDEDKLLAQLDSLSSSVPTFRGPLGRALVVCRRFLVPGRCGGSG